MALSRGKVPVYNNATDIIADMAEINSASQVRTIELIRPATKITGTLANGKIQTSQSSIGKLVNV